MGKIKLDFKHFKHIKSDKDTTTLQHKDGHMITLAHNSLPKESQEQLSALAKLAKMDQTPEDTAEMRSQKMARGGEAEEGMSEQGKEIRYANRLKSAGPMFEQASKSAASHAKSEAKGRAEFERTTKPNLKGLAEGGKVGKANIEKVEPINHLSPTEPEPGYTKMAEGGETPFSNPKESGLPCLNPYCKSHGKPHPNCRCYSGGEAYAEGGKVRHYCAKGMPHKPDCQYYADGGDVDEQQPQQQPQTYTTAELLEHGKNISPEVFNDAMNMAAGTMGSVRDVGGIQKLVPTPKNVGAEIQETTNKLLAAMAKYKNPENATIQILQGKLAGLHDMLKNFNYAEGGDVTRDSDGGIQNPKASDEGAGSKIMHALHELGSWLGEQGKAIEHGGHKEEAPKESALPTSLVQDVPQGTIPPALQAEPGIDQSDIATQAPVDVSPSPGPSTPLAKAATPTAAPQKFAQAPVPGTPAWMQNQANNPQQLPKSAQEQFTEDERNKLLKENAAWEQDLANQHITPKTYADLFHDKGTVGKIGQIFGLMLGGIGSGLTHQPNVAMEMMNNLIKNDLAAQTQSKTNAQNFLRIAQQGILNEANAKALNQDTAMKAYNLANMHINSGVLHTLRTEMEKLPPGSPQWQQANDALAMLYPAVQAENYNLADRYAVAKALSQQGGAPGQPSSEQNFQSRMSAMNSAGGPMANIAKYHIDRHLPGVQGEASDVIPADKKDRFNSMNTLDAQLQDLLKAVDQYSNLRGQVDPRIKAKLATKAHETAALYNQTLDGLGMTEGRMNWLQKQVPDNPQAFMERLKGSKEKLEEVARNNKMRKNVMLQSLGFPQAQAAPTEGATIERLDPATGRTVIFDAATKKPLRWKD